MLGHIFETGEHRLIRQCVEIVKISRHANAELISQIEKRRIDEKKMSALERRSDGVVFRLAFSITSGAIAPNVIDDFLVMINKEDDIMDSIYNLTREMNRYKMRSHLQKTMRERIGKVLALADLAMHELELMLNADTIKELRKHRSKIEEYEQAGDEIKDGILSYAYSADTNFKEFHYITELGHKADNILDSAEAAADYFLNIMLSLST